MTVTQGNGNGNEPTDITTNDIGAGVFLAALVLYVILLVTGAI